jgi:hypothetical protein
VKTPTSGEATMPIAKTKSAALTPIAEPSAPLATAPTAHAP